MYKIIVASLLFLALFSSSAFADTWQSDSSIISGLGDVGVISAPEVFNMNGEDYLIAGDGDGNFTGFVWTGSTWFSNSSIVSGLVNVAWASKPTVFEMDSAWNLISGDMDGNYTGYTWNGTGWGSNTSLISNLYMDNHQTAPSVFNMTGTLHMITGTSGGFFDGDYWNGSTWQGDWAITNGLNNVYTGNESTLTVFEYEYSWYVVVGNTNGTFLGFNWNGTGWDEDFDIVSGLGDVGNASAPNVFDIGGTFYLISGEEDGVFNGYILGGGAPTNPITFVSPTPDNASTVKQDYYYVNITYSLGSPYFCQLESNNVNYTMTCSGDNCYVNKTTQSDGLYTYKVYINDIFGVYNVSETRTVTLDTTPPNITLDSPTNTTYDTTSIDLNWSANESFSGAWYSLNGGNNTDFPFQWQSYSDIISGLGDISSRSSPTIFQKDSTWYLISGYQDSDSGYTGFIGFNWNGTGWDADSSIVSGLPITGMTNTESPTVFYKNSTWYLISGDSTGNFNGFSWSGSTWQTDSFINGSLSNVGAGATPTVFQKDGTWYFIAGKNDGTFVGYNWWVTDTWSADSAIISGLGDVGDNSAPTVFEKNGNWYLIAGEFDGVFNGFNWTGSTWQPDYVINSSLGDVGFQSVPFVFQKDGIHYLISGEVDGVFTGFNLITQNTTITATEGSNNVTVYANDTAGNVGSETEYFTVSTSVASNAVFSIALPSDYATFTNATGENETDATSYDWISFNFTQRPQYYVQPYQLGSSGNAQNGATQPIFLIDNMGNVNINISFRFESALPTGITVEGNATCSGTYTSCQATSLPFNTSYTQLVNNLSYTDSFANITMYSNMSLDASPNSTGFTMYIQGIES